MGDISNAKELSQGIAGAFGDETDEQARKRKQKSQDAAAEPSLLDRMKSMVGIDQTPDSASQKLKKAGKY